jgi:hypothetical protein
MLNRSKPIMVKADPISEMGFYEREIEYNLKH